MISTAATLASGIAHADTYNVLFENDLFYRHDRDYTNGIEFNWTPSAGKSASKAEWLTDRLPGFFGRDRLFASYSLGQMIFTPEDTKAFDPPPDMRPYAGYLYGAIAVTGKTEEQEDQLRIQLGMIGPMSLAADSQDFVHRIRGFALPQGWHTQLRDEPGLVISFRRANTVTAFQMDGSRFLDVTGNYGAAIGNVFDYADAGLTARLGFNLPSDSGPPQIDPSRPGSRVYQPAGAFGAFLFASVQGRAVARNLFLDGNSFQSSRSVAKENFVGDLSLGMALDFQQFRLSFTHVFRSREYLAQKGFDQFGVVNLSVNN